MHTRSKKVRLSGLLVLVLVPRLALADPPAPVVPVPPGEDKIEAVKKGDPAPFTGQLFDQATSLRWANYLQQYRFRLTSDVELQKKLDQAEIDFQKRLVTIEQEKYTRVVTDLEEKNKKLQLEVADPPFYKTVWFGIVAGGVAAFAAVGLAAWGLSATN